MDQPDAISEHRRGLSKTLAIAALTGATAVALTLPTVAQAQPVAGAAAAAATDGNTVVQPPPGAPAPPRRPTPTPTAATGRPQRTTAAAGRPQRATAATGRPQRATGRPERTAAASTGRARPRRQRRGRIQLCRPCGLEGVGFHPVVVRPGVVDEDRPRRRPTAERHERSARTARPQAVRRRGNRQHQGRTAVGFRHGRILHAVPGHSSQPGKRAARRPPECRVSRPITK